MGKEKGKKKWAVREGGLFLEPRGCPTGLFPASPLAFASSSCSSLSCLSLQLLTVLLLSSQPFSWGPGLQEPGQGVHTGALGAHFDFHPQNHYN